MANFPRPPEELRAAVETMFRVRASESSPDEQGQRVLWHRGSRGADLTTYVDRQGVVFRQELQLFDEYFVWEQRAGLRTGEPVEISGNSSARATGDYVFDVAEKLRLGRVQRAHLALKDYDNADKSIKHFRRVIDLVMQGARETVAGEPITRSADTVKYEEFISESQKIRLSEVQARLRIKRQQLIWAAALGVGLLAIAGYALWPR